MDESRTADLPFESRVFRKAAGNSRLFASLRRVSGRFTAQRLGKFGTADISAPFYYENRTSLSSETYYKGIFPEPEARGHWASGSSKIPHGWDAPLSWFHFGCQLHGGAPPNRVLNGLHTGSGVSVGTLLLLILGKIICVIYLWLSEKRRRRRRREGRHPSLKVYHAIEFLPAGHSSIVHEFEFMVLVSPIP